MRTLWRLIASFLNGTIRQQQLGVIGRQLFGASSDRLGNCSISCRPFAER